MKLASRLMKFFCFTIVLYLLVPNWAWAYPEFIGIGYSSCLTCHFNGHGNGPLNDYGRALMSAEISSRMLTSNDEERLSRSSGFLGSVNLPWWLRPGVKARGLAYQTNPGGPSSKTDTVLMQADFNLAILFDKQAELAVIGSYGYAPTPARLSKRAAKDIDNWISREHYVRYHATKSLWMYVGMLDKVYGIRTVNHTAYSRLYTGIAQNDQAHGVVLHYVEPTWEFTLNPFVGNLYQEANLRQMGASMLFEKEVGKDVRLGFSALSSANKYVKNDRAGIQARAGFGYGAALLVDTGIIRDTPKSGTAKTGYYAYSQISQKLTRGYYLLFVGQAYNQGMTAGDSDFVKAGAGLLMFPLPRFELRAEVENTRKISASSVTPEGWLAMLQLHLSL